jgi:hypothetical protein
MMTNAIKSEANGLTSILTLAQEIRQQIYYNSFTSACKRDLMHNKKGFCFAADSIYQLRAAEIPAMKKQAHKLNKVHPIINAELIFVLEKVKRETDDGFAKMKPAGLWHLRFRCDEAKDDW